MSFPSPRLVACAVAVLIPASPSSRRTVRHATESREPIVSFERARRRVSSISLRATVDRGNPWIPPVRHGAEEA